MKNPIQDHAYFIFVQTYIQLSYSNPSQSLQRNRAFSMNFDQLTMHNIDNISLRKFTNDLPFIQSSLNFKSWNWSYLLLYYFDTVKILYPRVWNIDILISLSIEIKIQSHINKALDIIIEIYFLKEIKM